MTHLKNTILQHIKDGSIDMKPKWHFALQGIFYASGLLLMLLIGMYLLSFLLFILRETGLWWVPGFGLGGLMFFVMQSPWVLILICSIFLLATYMLVRHFGHQYRHRAAYTLLGVILCVVAGASLLDYFAIHDQVRNFSDRRHIPGLSPLYRHGSDNRPEDITPGQVIGIERDVIIIKNREGIYTVSVSDAKKPREYQPQINDHILIFGPKNGTSTIKAKAFRPLPAPMEPQLERKRIPQ